MTLAEHLHAASVQTLQRLALWLGCLPRFQQPGEADGAYRRRLVHAILRFEKSSIVRSKAQGGNAMARP